MALTTSLISFWELEEASGSRADAVGGNTLTDNATVTSGTGKVGIAAQFTAANSEFLSHTDNASLSTGDIDFSLSFWIKVASDITNQTVISKGNEYIVFIGGGTFDVHFGVDSITGTVASTTAFATVGTWTHIVVWHDSVANQIGVALNAGTPDTTSYSNGTPDTASDFRIGQYLSNLYFDGLVDQVGFWKRVLTSQDRTDLYNSGAGLSYAAMAGGRAAKNTRASNLGMELGVNLWGEL